MKEFLFAHAYMLSITICVFMAIFVIILGLISEKIKVTINNVENSILGGFTRFELLIITIVVFIPYINTLTAAMFTIVCGMLLFDILINNKWLNSTIINNRDNHEG